MVDPKWSDPYGFGKAVAKVARLALIAEEVGNATLAAKAVQGLRGALQPWLNGSNADAFVYDTTWKGLISSNGVESQDADFGNGWYNGEHKERKTMRVIIAYPFSVIFFHCFDDLQTIIFTTDIFCTLSRSLSGRTHPFSAKAPMPRQWKPSSEMWPTPGALVLVELILACHHLWIRLQWRCTFPSPAIRISLTPIRGHRACFPCPTVRARSR